MKITIQSSHHSHEAQSGSNGAITQLLFQCGANSQACQLTTSRADQCRAYEETFPFLIDGFSADARNNAKSSTDNNSIVIAQATARKFLSKQVALDNSCCKRPRKCYG